VKIELTIYIYIYIHYCRNVIRSPKQRGKMTAKVRKKNKEITTKERGNV